MYFLDTNILIYAFDKQDSRKEKIAHELMRPDRDWSISWQVVQEFTSYALHKLKPTLDSSVLEAVLELVLLPRCTVYPSSEIFLKSLKIHQQTQYRIYDSLIVASALASKAPILYSEDLQDGRKIENLTIQNPFN